MHYVGQRHPLANASPLRSLPLLRSAESVFGPSRRTIVLNDVRRALIDVQALRNAYVRALADLADANRRPMKWANKGQNVWQCGMPIEAEAPSCRRYYQGQALRKLNAARRALPAAKRALDAAQAEAAALTLADATPLRLIEMRAAQQQAA